MLIEYKQKGAQRKTRAKEAEDGGEEDDCDGMMKKYDRYSKAHIAFNYHFLSLFHAIYYVYRFFAHSVCTFARLHKIIAIHTQWQSKSNRLYASVYFFPITLWESLSDRKRKNFIAEQ